MMKMKLTGEMSDMNRAVGTELTIDTSICTINVGHVTSYTGEFASCSPHQVCPCTLQFHMLLDESLLPLH